MEFGIIGRGLQHSFSKRYFNEKFRKLGLAESCIYSEFSLNSISDVEEIIAKHKDLVGFNVTSPYKEEILPYLDEIDSIAAEIGAVNVVKIKRNGGVKLKGYNSDVEGIAKTLYELHVTDKEKALVFGSGGAAKAVVYVLRQMGINYKIVTRTPREAEHISYQALSKEKILEHKLLINATPLGLFPNINNCISIDYTAITDKHICFDLIYNPAETLFLQKCASRGARVCNGLKMLCEQADVAWQIWNRNEL